MTTDIIINRSDTVLFLSDIHDDTKGYIRVLKDDKLVAIVTSYDEYYEIYTAFSEATEVCRNNFQDYLDRELGTHQELIGVYSTEERALDEIDNMIGDDYYVEEYEIDV